MNKKATLITIISTISIIAVLAIIIPIIIVFGTNTFKNFDLSNTHIKNFENYKSISAGQTLTINNANKGNTTLNICNNIYQTTPKLNTNIDTKNNKIKLYGETKLGKYEEIIFEKDDEETIEQNFYLRQIIVISKFMFITYANYECNCNILNIHDNSIYNNQYLDFFYDDYNKTFIIDIQNGNIYSVEQIVNKIFGWGKNIDFNNIAYNKNSICFNFTQYIENNKEINFIYKIYIKNNQLVCKEMISSDKLSFGTEYMLCDNYGNLYLKNQNSLYCKQYYNFIITKDLKIKNLNNLEIYKSINGYVYTKDNTKKFDANGNLIDSEDKTEDIYLDTYGNYYKNNITFLGNDNNICYYIFDETINHTEVIGNTQIIKATFEKDKTNFIIEKINIEKKYTDFAFGNNKIYFLNTNKVFYYDLILKTFKDLTADYIFNSITTDVDNNIFFTGVDNSLNSVKGFIKADDSIEIEITPKEINIVYIQPINRL